MRNKSKALLRKVSGLLKINNIFHSKNWPVHVLDTLEAKYRLLPEDMLRLWYIRRRVLNGKYPVDSLFIYDWARACEKNISVRDRKDLYRNSDLLLYKGNIFGNGSIYVERVRNLKNN